MKVLSFHLFVNPILMKFLGLLGTFFMSRGSRDVSQIERVTRKTGALYRKWKTYTCTQYPLPAMASMLPVLEHQYAAYLLSFTELLLHSSLK